MISTVCCSDTDARIAAGTRSEGSGAPASASALAYAAETLAAGVQVNCITGDNVYRVLTAGPRLWLMNP